MYAIGLSVGLCSLLIIGGRSVISLAIQHVLSHTLQTSGAEVATIAVSLQFAFILKSKEQA